MELRKIRRELSHLAHATRPAEFRLARRWLALGPGERLCDVGCGDGYWTSRLAGGGRQVVGADVDADAVARARRFYGRAAAFVVADGSRLPLADGSFDKLLGLCMLQHFSDDAAALCEFRRVLRPGGRLCLSLDSLSRPEIGDDYRALQAGHYQVRHLYQHTTIAGKLELAGFVLRCHAYLATSALACRLIQLQVRRGWEVNYLAPLGKPLAALADAFRGSRDQGYSLVIMAEKRPD